jgi:hypothetical protein
MNGNEAHAPFGGAGYALPHGLANIVHLRCYVATATSRNESRRR